MYSPLPSVWMCTTWTLSPLPRRLGPWSASALVRASGVPAAEPTNTVVPGRTAAAMASTASVATRGSWPGRTWKGSAVRESARTRGFKVGLQMVLRFGSRRPQTRAQGKLAQRHAFVLTRRTGMSAGRRWTPTAAALDVCVPCAPSLRLLLPRPFSTRALPAARPGSPDMAMHGAAESWYARPARRARARAWRASMAKELCGRAPCVGQLIGS